MSGQTSAASLGSIEEKGIAANSAQNDVNSLVLFKMSFYGAPTGAWCRSQRGRGHCPRSSLCPVTLTQS